jgi:hypothetical protein
MAQKKFSRLSIMLEARDKMTKPLQQASKASQGLQSRVNQLSNALNKSRNSVVNATVSQRILADKYKELARQVGVTDNKVKMSKKLFDKLPATFKLAAYSIEGYGKSLYNVITQNILAKTTTKVLSLSMTALYNTTSLLSSGLTKATKWLWNFSRAGKIVKTLAAPFKLISNEVKTLGNNIKVAVKNSFGFKVTSAIIKTIGKDIKLAATSMKTFAKDIPTIAKSSRVWQNLSLKIAYTKRELGKAYLSFNLWKNASPAVEKVTNKFNSLGRAVSKLAGPLKKNISGIQQFNNKMTQTGGRGRATFNQLASANAKLNREITKMNKELSKANSRLGSMKSSMGSLNHMGAAFGTAYAAQAAYGTAERGVTATVGTAMEQQYSSESVGILAGAENGAKFYKQIQNYAASTAYATEDWARNMRGAISKSKSIKDLEKYQIVMEQLATLDPIQGLDGAALAVRELNSGDIVSLVERFELPRSALKDIKGIENPIKQIEALSELIGDSTGYTVKNVQKMKELPLMQWQKMTNLIKTAMGYIGAGALEKLSPLFEKFNKMWDAGKFEPFIAKLSDGFASITGKAINFVTNMGSNIEGIKAKWQPFLDLIGNIKSSLSEAMPTIITIMDNARIIFNNVAADVNAVWPTVNTVFQTAVGLVKDFSSWVVNNWPAITAVVAGVVTAMMTLKVANAIAAGIGLLKTAMALWRNGTLLATAAQWALNTALLANPIGLVIALVVGLAAGLFVAYQKSETFRNAVQGVLGWLKDVGVGALELGKKAVDGLVDGFKNVTDWVGKAWDKFMGFVDALKNNPVGTLVDGAKKVAGWVTGGGKGHHGGLSHVPYDGYNARLHKGERVLTAQENKDYNNGQGGGQQPLVTGNTFIVRKESDIDAIADLLYRKLYEAQLG